jgi:hypothetical protein
LYRQRRLAGGGRPDQRHQRHRAIASVDHG